MTFKLTCRSKLMAGKTCLVTGATDGIGRATALELAHMGADVVIVGRNQAKCAATAIDMREDSGNASVEYLVADLSSQEEVRRLADEFKQCHQTLDVLVNNAGVMDGQWGDLTEIDDEWALKVIDINALGPVRIVQALYDKMTHRTLTKVAMVSSLMGSIDDCHMGRSYAYRASKAALNMFTVAMKKEAAEEKITFAILHPGWVKTDMGGDSAPVEISDSVRGMRKVLESQTLDNSGRFIQFDGELLPW